MIGDIEAARRVAGRALAHYGSAPDRGDPALTFVKYRENYVFRADHEGVTSALRLHRKGYRTDVEIVEELDLITALADAGVAVPRMRRTLNGRPFCHVIDDDGDVHQVDLLEWVPDATTLGDIGAAFTGEASIDREAFHALGALIAQLHDAVATLPRRASVRPAWDAEGPAGGRDVRLRARTRAAAGRRPRGRVRRAITRRRSPTRGASMPATDDLQI